MSSKPGSSNIPSPQKTHLRVDQEFADGLAWDLNAAESVVEFVGISAVQGSLKPQRRVPAQEAD
jgi:hypothetical protein